jgi:hypothetical protein
MMKGRRSPVVDLPTEDDLAELLVMLTAREWTESQARTRAIELRAALSRPREYFAKNRDDAFVVKGLKRSDPEYLASMLRWLLMIAVDDRMISADGIHDLAQQALEAAEGRSAALPRDWDVINHWANRRLAEERKDGGGMQLVEWDDTYSDSVQCLKVLRADLPRLLHLVAKFDLRVEDSAIDLAQRRSRFAEWARAIS